MSSNCFPWENSSCEFTATFYWRVEGEAASVCADLEDRFSDGQPRMTALKKFYSFFLSFVLELSIYIYIERER